MRNSLYVKVFTFLLLCVFTLWSGISLAGEFKIVDSGHDLSYGSTGSNFKYKTNQVCVFCHTPHDADKTNALTGRKWAAGGYTGGGSPLLLWNRPFANVTSSDYLTYQSSSLDANAGGGINEVRVYSLMCMSCHDGVSALNIVHNIPADVEYKYGTDFIPPDTGVKENMAAAGWDGTGMGWGPNIGERLSDTDDVNLSNDHPISFDYDNTLYTTDNGLKDPSNVLLSTSLRLFQNPSGTPNVSLECPTCHDVHNEGNKNNGTYPFLRMSNNDSAMCTSCHLK